MKILKTPGFTLVELIIVISILSVLGTIAYISVSEYSQDARNSNRISDIKTIEKGLSLLLTSDRVLPIPDNSTSITYSGATLWTQGVFGQNSLVQLQRISEIPVDPGSQIPYSYSLSANKQMYQISGAIEGSLLSANPFIPSSYALTSDDLTSFTSGNYINYTLPANISGNCNMITIPSLVLSEIPSGGVIEDNSSYHFSYYGSEHIPHTYSGSAILSSPGSAFQTVNILDTCSINTITELELYIAQLSTAYQRLSSLSAFERVVFDSASTKFKLTIAQGLKERGITIAPEILEELQSPLPDQVMVDTFTDSDSTLISSHTPDSGSGSWIIFSGGVASAYNISSNTLTKNDSSSTLTYPSPIPNITSADYEVSFDIENFAGGEIESYLRYSDSDNYYKLTISSTGYTLTRRYAGGDSIFQDISETISTGSNIRFSIRGNTLSFDIDGVNKETIVGGSVTAQGNPMIGLQNGGAAIDNYTLTYQ